MTIKFFATGISYAITSFVIFAFFDSICLKADLYDRAPTPDNIMFNTNDDRLFFKGGTTQIMAGDLSNMGSNEDIPNLYNYSNTMLSKRNNDLSKFSDNSYFTNVSISTQLQY